MVHQFVDHPVSIRTPIDGNPIKVACRIHHYPAFGCATVVATSEVIEGCVGITAPAIVHQFVDHTAAVAATVLCGTKHIAQAVDERRREHIATVGIVETSENRISLGPGGCNQ